MTEREKFLKNLPFIPYGGDGTLAADHLKAKMLFRAFNDLPAEADEEKAELLKQLLGKIGKDSYIEQPFRCDYGYMTEIGDNFFSNYNLTILDCAKVTIGNNVLIAPNVSIYAVGHPIHPHLRSTGVERGEPVTIGNNVWIGGSCVINPGVTIGDNTLIGSGSVVTKDIPPNVIAVGNPCKVLRRVTQEDKKEYAVFL